MNLSIDQWEDLFKPVPNHLDPNLAAAGSPADCKFETYGPELEYVRSILMENPGRVWTLMQGDLSEIESDDDEQGDRLDDLVIVSGYHIVNRLAYYITEKAVPDAMAVEVWDEETLSALNAHRLSQLEGRQVLESLLELTSWYQRWSTSDDPASVGDPDIAKAQRLLAQFGQLTPDLETKLGVGHVPPPAPLHPDLLPSERLLSGSELMQPGAYYMLFNRMGESHMYQMGAVAESVTTFRQNHQYRGETIMEVYTCDRISRGYSAIPPQQQEGIDTYLKTYFGEYSPRRNADGPAGKTSVDQSVHLPELGITLNIATPSPLRAGDTLYLYWHLVTPQLAL